MSLKGWRVGPFELDARSRELSRNGQRIRLQEQPFAILCALLERAGEVVTRDELRDRLWPNGTFVDFEHSLNAAVKRLRAALGDDPAEPRFVETVPRVGYRLVPDIGRRGAAAADAGPRPRRIAVLPFIDQSHDAEHTTLSDGLTDETIAQLSTICRGRFAVMARRSTIGYMGTSDRLRDIVDALRVTHVLEGGVRSDGSGVRVTIRLIDANEETLVWSESYHRSAPGPDAETDIATRIAHGVAHELSSVREESPPVDSDAYRAFLKGRYFFSKPGDDGLDQALNFYAEGVKLAPTFASAHAAVGRGLVSRAEYYREVPRDALIRARVAALRALDLDPRQSEGHLTLADVSRMYDFDWAAAEGSYRTAISFNPSHEGAHRSYAVLLSAQSRHVEARTTADRALRLDPACLQGSAIAAWVRCAAGDLSGAIEQCQYTLELDPEYAPAIRLLGAAYLMDKRPEESLATFDRAIDHHDDDPVLLSWSAYAKGQCGDRGGAEALLTRLEGAHQYVPAFHLGLAYLGSGHVDKAFAALERGYDQRDPAFCTLATDSRFEPLRDDERFGRLVQRARLNPPTKP